MKARFPWWCGVSPRVGLAALALFGLGAASWLEGVSMREEARRFYRKVLGFRLTGAQLESVLDPERR
jgi:hypothetical protein